MSEQQTSNSNAGGDEAAAEAAATAAAEAARGGASDDKGVGEGKSWLDGLKLPDDVRTDPTVAKFAADPEGMARSLIHLQKHFGIPAEQIVRLPKPDDAEGNAKLWNSLGRPETPDKYEVKIPDGTDLDKAGLDSFLAHMHKAGPLTPAMAQGVADWYAGYSAQLATARQAEFAAAQEQGTQALKAEWGAQFEDNLDAAAEMAERFGGKDYVKFLKDSGQGNDPANLKAWAAVAKAAGERSNPDPGGKGGGGKGGGLMSPAEAEAALTVYSTAGSPEYTALNDPAHAQHDFHVNRRNTLFQMKRGQRPD
ncbi:hypothetical protein [Brevundimonas sp.]|uniref:hypothetical protein n=1 Tax=Brevundimonas sp. TaxID=1871086 RepID=UPI0026348C03|nr:hypothetical protein [Brevundimonas sp.]